MLSFCIVDARDLEVFIMVSINSRTEEDKIKVINKDANNKFKWSWLEKTVIVQIGKEMHKIVLADCSRKDNVCGKAQCCECLDLINYASRGVNTLIRHCQTKKHIRGLATKLSDICKPGCSINIHSYIWHRLS